KVPPKLTREGAPAQPPSVGLAANCSDCAPGGTKETVALALNQPPWFRFPPGIHQPNYWRYPLPGT
ncbi:hypothetical protein LB507_007807, partial [Fusarium sp. FIESC RH6]